MKTKYEGYTLDDWHYTFRKWTSGYSYEIHSNRGHEIADTMYSGSAEQDKANATLIADSPKLLAALVKIVEAREVQSQHIDMGIIEGSVDRMHALINAIDEASKLIQEEAK